MKHSPSLGRTSQRLQLIFFSLQRRGCKRRAMRLKAKEGLDEIFKKNPTTFLQQSFKPLYSRFGLIGLGSGLRLL